MLFFGASVRPSNLLSNWSWQIFVFCFASMKYFLSRHFDRFLFSPLLPHAYKARNVPVYSQTRDVVLEGDVKYRKSECTKTSMSVFRNASPIAFFLYSIFRRELFRYVSSGRPD